MGPITTVEAKDRVLRDEIHQSPVDAAQRAAWNRLLWPPLPWVALRWLMGGIEKRKMGAGARRRGKLAWPS